MTDAFESSINVVGRQLNFFAGFLMDIYGAQISPLRLSNGKTLELYNRYTAECYISTVPVNG